jgi:hypothetical protein
MIPGRGSNRARSKYNTGAFSLHQIHSVSEDIYSLLSYLMVHFRLKKLYTKCHQMKCKHKHEFWKDKDLEGNGRDPFQCTTTASVWAEKKHEIPQSIQSITL